MKFAEAVNAFLDIYNSIDVRIAAYKQDDAWNAGFIVVRFRVENIDELHRIQNHLWKEHETIENENFKIFLISFDIKGWDKFKENWSKNRIVLLDKEIIIKNNGELEYGNSKPDNHSLYDNINTDWPSYFVNQSTNNPKINTFRELDDEANARTYENILEYISEVFEVPNSTIRQQGANIFVAPVFFHLDSPRFSDNKFRIEGRGAITNVLGNMKISNTDSNGMPLKTKERVAINTSDFKVLKGYGKFVKFYVEKELRETTPEDHYKIVVTRNNVIVSEESRIIKPYWPKSNVTNPIFSVFEKFVTFEEFEDMLLEPKPIKMKSKNIPPEDVFERAVEWLMNLLGLPAIHLQEYDQSGKGMGRISTDIISSYNTTHIILTHITIGTIGSSEIDDATNTSKQIAKSLNDVKIISVHFTPKSVQQARSTLIQDNQILIGGEELKMILSYLKNGDVDDARKMIIPNMYSF